MVRTAPEAAVELDAHADGAPVAAVRQEAHPGGPHGRRQLRLHLQVRVRVARQDLHTTRTLTTLFPPETGKRLRGSRF